MYNLDDPKIVYSLENKEYTYTGEKIKPSISITIPDDEIELIEGTDYQLDYQDNLNVGIGKIIVVAIGENYEGEKPITFNILPVNISDNDDIVISHGFGDENNCFDPQNTIVLFKDQELSTETDYDIEISDKYENRDGYYKVDITISGKNNFAGELVDTINVELLPEPKDISELAFYLSKTKYIYSGESNTPEVTIEDGDELIDSKYYDVEFSDNINAGEATVIVTGNTRYTGTKELTFTIEPISIETSVVSCGIKDEDECYNLDNLKVRFANDLILSKSDYETNISTELIDGFYESTIVITGIGNYCGSITVNYRTGKYVPPELTTIDINPFNFILNQSKFTFNWDANTPEVKVINTEGTILVEGIDYEKSYKDNTNAGTGYVVVEGIGDYHGIKEIPFIIDKKDMSNGKLTCGSADEDGCYNLNNIRVTVDDIDLEKMIDYSIQINSDQDGFIVMSTVTVDGVGNFTGSIIKTFKSQKIIIDISDGEKVEILFSKTVYTYTGDPIIPEIIVYGLEEGIDYEIICDEAVNIGTYTVTIKGIGNYTGFKQFQFRIETKTIENANITCGEPDANNCYDLNNLTVDIDGIILEKSKDFQFFATEKEIEDGFIESTVTVIGINNYTGKQVITILTSRLQIYSGKTIHLELATIYPRYGTVKSNVVKTGIYYLWDNQVVNNRIRITNNPIGIGRLGFITGWVSMDDIIERTDIRVGDKVIVKGRINSYADGTGYFMNKDNIAMYVVDRLDDTMFEYSYGVASDINRARQGWAKLEMLTVVKDIDEE